MTITGEMSGFLRTMGESGQEESRRSCREPTISEEAGKHITAEEAVGGVQV